MIKPTEVVVLCEDGRTFSFARRYLIKCGITGIRPRISPKGCGYDFVMNEFAMEVNAYRIANARKRAWLIAIVDADEGTVDQRLGKMDKKLATAQEPRVRQMRINDEKIARLVPRRHIETWLLLLNDIQVLNDKPIDEKRDLKREKHNAEWDALILPAAAAFYKFTRPNAELPEYLLDSLRHGIQEMKRVFQAVG